MFAFVVTWVVKRQNIRRLGNNNPGAANVFKSVGPVWGVLTGLLDASKALVPILIADRALGMPVSVLGVIGVGAIFGHGFPLYFRFRGGRAAGSLMGIFIYFIPWEFLGALVVTPFIVAMVIKKNRSYWMPLTIIASSGFASLFFNHPWEVKIAVVLTALSGLFMNRLQLPIMVRELREAPEDGGEQEDR
jgi:glycerol-3-phosphate acyltransferase PlsY